MLSKWLRQNLNKGDLNALRDLSKGRIPSVDSGAIDRLEVRGFVVRRAPARITLLGRIALYLRRRARRQ